MKSELLDRLDDKLCILEGEDFRARAIQKVMHRIYNGHSALRGPLQAGMIKISDVVKAIHNKRCLRGPDQDFGATYMEQILGSAIRDSIPVQHINKVREIFGLDALPPSELVKHKNRGTEQAQTQPA